uniref:Uncharacterized protein n=1 Tax=Panagrolaimus superbus TaxID=310955 RepID=A0A914Z9F1_9BILA
MAMLVTLARLHRRQTAEAEAKLEAQADGLGVIRESAADWRQHRGVGRDVAVQHGPERVAAGTGGRAAVGGIAHDCRAACTAGAGGAVWQHRCGGGALLFAVHLRIRCWWNEAGTGADRAGGAGAAGRSGDHPAGAALADRHLSAQDRTGPGRTQLGEYGCPLCGHHHRGDLGAVGDGPAAEQAGIAGQCAVGGYWFRPAGDHPELRVRPDPAGRAPGEDRRLGEAGRPGRRHPPHQPAWSPRPCAT